jgi:hypothetical protein
MDRSLITSTDGSYRTSQAERDAVAEELRQHTADGRLTYEELESRLEECLNATTFDQLTHSLRELPPLRPERDSRAVPFTATHRPPIVLLAVVGLVTVLIAAGAAVHGHPFPFVPLVPIAIWATIIRTHAMRPGRQRR